jgi:hypothetical protein
VITAGLKGIDLRQFREITDDEITQKWPRKFSAELISTSFTVTNIGLSDDRGMEIDPAEVSPEIIQMFESGGVD